jgi:hypothetical protein
VKAYAAREQGEKHRDFKKKEKGVMMNGQDQNGWVTAAIKMTLSLAALFPLYALVYITYPASLIAFYLISAAVVALFAPWDELKRRFIED